MTGWVSFRGCRPAVARGTRNPTDLPRQANGRESGMRFDACAVYILANLNRSVLYVGVTGDLLRRVAEHREHLDPRSFTSRYRVDRLVHFEPFQDIVRAIEREKQLKGWSRTKKIALIERTNRGWQDRWPEIVG